MPTYINDWSFERYSYTFTTGAAGTYRVGIDPPYAQGNGGRFWGAQLKKGLHRQLIFIHGVVSPQENQMVYLFQLMLPAPTLNGRVVIQTTPTELL